MFGLDFIYRQIISFIQPFLTGIFISLITLLLTFWSTKLLRWFLLLLGRLFKRINFIARFWYTAGQLVPFILWPVVVISILPLFELDLALLAGVLAGFGFALPIALQDFLKGVAGYFLVVLNDSYRKGSVLEVEGAVVTVKNIGLFSTSVIDHAKDAVRIIPNAELVGSTIINYDREKAAKMTMILPSDFNFQAHPDYIEHFETQVTQAIVKKFSVGRKKASCSFINVAGNAYEFRLTGFTHSPVEHRDEMPKMYRTAVIAALNAGFSVGRTDNITMGNSFKIGITRKREPIGEKMASYSNGGVKRET
ncbi:MAG: mechanosensitive ion channel domain-containing protein [Chloroflexota bacterium]